MHWQQLCLIVTPAQAECFESALLELGALSVTLMDAADQPIFEPDLGTTPLWSHTQLLALFAQEQDLSDLSMALHKRTQEPTPECHIQLIEEQDWVRSWMDLFQPMQFGKRLWVVPSWHQTPDPQAVNLLLDPGIAFGTGTHPTTTLCLEWLEEQVQIGDHLLDIGCGSGILAIASLLLGAHYAVGTDIDPQALDASAANAARNHIEAHRLKLLPAAELPERTFDVVVANILAGPLMALAKTIAARIRPGGRLALSGILAEQVSSLMAYYQAYFVLDPPALLNGWARISGVKRSLAAADTHRALA